MFGLSLCVLTLLQLFEGFSRLKRGVMIGWDIFAWHGMAKRTDEEAVPPLARAEEAARVQNVCSMYMAQRGTGRRGTG